MAEKIGAFDYVECSAKENKGLHEVFHSATRAAMCKSKGKRSFLKSILGGGAAKTPETAKLKEEALAIKAKAKEEAAAEKARVKQIQTEEKAEKARVKAAATAAAQAFNWHKRAASARAKAIKVRMKAEADEKKWLKTATPLQIKKRHREKAADAAAAAAAAAAREAFMSGAPVAPPSAPVVVESAYETLATTMQQKRPCPYVSSKGSCNRMFVAGAHVTFCMMHTCTKVGCNAKKTSRDDFCPQHVDGPKEKAPELPPLPASFAPPSSPPLQPVSHTPTSPTPLFDATNPFGPPPTLATSVNVNTSTNNPFGDGGISDDENDYDTCDTATDPSEMAAFAAQPMRVSKYLAKIRLGKQEQTALGLEDLMGVDDDQKSKFLSIKEEAIKQEFALNGKEEDKDNLKHVLAGTYRKDWGRSVAESVALEELLTSEQAKTAKLAYHHVLALRLYTTSSYRQINDPLREDPPPKLHPFAATTYFIQEGIKKLRAVDAKSGGTETKIFWRGMHGRSLPPSFKDEGGAEFACMSTTADVQVAVKFAEVETSDMPMLFKYVTDNSLVRGADISFLSVYPEEKEVLYPPLTYLQQISCKQCTIRGKRVVVVEVKPQMA